jgi:putative SOS response-associated peptidase YedK
MCGRFNLRTSATGIAECFLPGLDPANLPQLQPRYNIAPTQWVPVVVEREADRETQPARRLELFRWGLLPPWADSLSIGSRMINARSETVTEKRSFSGPFKSRRCILPADGYYEWQKTEAGKQPYEFSLASGGLLAMAGLWEVNRRAGEAGQTIYSCTVLTTAANQLAATVHDRMPVLLDEAAVELWLDPQFENIAALQDLLRPAPDDWLVKRPVNKQLGNVKNEGPELLQHSS